MATSPSMAAATYRVCNPDGSLITDPAALGFPLAVAQKMTNYPDINPILGNPEYQLTQACAKCGL